MSTNLIVYGASDDLIETTGLVREEFDSPYDLPAEVVIRIDDAVHARLAMEYDPDGSGEWRIQPTSLGSLVSVTPARGEDEGDDEHGCPGYSDKAVVEMLGVEARRVSITVREATR